MGKESFQFARITSPEEVGDYLSSLAHGLKRGELSLESGERALHLVPASEVKLEIRLKDKEEKGKLTIEIGWKRRTGTRVSELAIHAAPRSPRS